MTPKPMTSAIIGAAIDVHRALGPGLLESAYRICLAHELTKRGHEIQQEKPIPLIYDTVSWSADSERIHWSTEKSS